jgi:hypothetical protein
MDDIGKPKDIFSLLQSLFHVENAGNSYSELATLPPHTDLTLSAPVLARPPFLVSQTQCQQPAIPPSPGVAGKHEFASK